MKMTNETSYRVAGVCGLLSIILFSIEIPLYAARGLMPSNNPASLIGYATRNAANMLIVVLLDTMICGLLLFFLAGFRRLIRDGQPSSMWLATQVFGAGVVYTAFTLYADLLQGVIAFNALSGDPDPSLIRAFLSSRYPVFGAMTLIFSAVLLSAASYVAHASRAFPAITTWIGYCGAVLCLVLVPFAIASGPNPTTLLYTVHLDAISKIAIVPVSFWMIAIAIAMFRTESRQPEAH